MQDSIPKTMIAKNICGLSFPINFISFSSSSCV
jgi:hypothetical protein